MKKLLRKSALLFWTSLAMCAFVVPSMASAASWGVIPSTHSLLSANFSFLSFTPSGTIGAACDLTQFDADVQSATTLTLTTASFRGCTGSGALGQNCTVTAAAANLDWTVHAPTLSTVTINGVRVNTLYENKPGSATCAVLGLSVLLTGNLGGGVWIAGGRHLTYANAEGLVAHSAIPGGSPTATVTATIRDGGNSWTLT